MRKVVTGILALIIPVFLFAQTAKEAQDLTQIQQKINRLERENQQLKKQGAAVQKSLARMGEAMAKEEITFQKYDSLIKGCEDTVKTYSARIGNAEQLTIGVKHAMRVRTIIVIILLLIIFLAILIRWLTHVRQHAKEKEEWLEKLKNQREEREKRIGEVTGMILKHEEEHTGFRQSIEERVSHLKNDLTVLDGSLRQLIGEKSVHLENQLREKFEKGVKDQERGIQEVAQKVNEMDTKGSGMVRKLDEELRKHDEIHKKLMDQLVALQKSSDEIRVSLTREIQQLKNK